MAQSGRTPASQAQNPEFKPQPCSHSVFFLYSDYKVPGLLGAQYHTWFLLVDFFFSLSFAFD
jgi:hypothetical protein